jgi:hypothetical protein
MRQWLAPAHLVLTLVIIVWNIILAGRIAQVRHATRGFALISGFAALMLLPAFIVALATTTLITGRAIASIDWVWPATVLLVAIQAVYAVSRKLVNPLWGYPIAFYDVVVAIAALARYATAHGVDVPYPFLIVMAAQIDALALATTEAAIASPFFLHVPFIAPAFPAIGRATAGIRAGVAGLALLWFGLILAEMPRANQALSSYAAHADDRLTERHDRFPVGVKIFPDLRDQPSGASAKADIELATATTVNAIHIVLVPGATAVAIDSVGRAIDLLQRDSIKLVVTIGYSGTLLPEIGKGELDADVRLQTLRRALTRLRPDIVVPAQDPYGVGARVLGKLPVATWQEFYTRARALVHEVRPRTQVAIAASAYDAQDSTLYAWAARRGSPVDVVGFSFYPNRLGARFMVAGFRAADRWMDAHPPVKPHWVLGTGGYPLAHGEESHALAIWATLAWATSHPQIRGVLVMEASDYGEAMGLRAPNGRYRQAATSVRRALNGLRETEDKPRAPTAIPRAP